MSGSPRYELHGKVRLAGSTSGPWTIEEIHGNGTGWQYRLDDGALPHPEADLEDLSGSPYTLYTAADALAPQPPIDWIISDLFSAGSVSLLVGDPGSAKTYSLLDAAVCVAQGHPWLTYATASVPVLMVDEESGPRRLARRLGDVLRGHNAATTTPVFYLTLERFNLQAASEIQRLTDAIEETKARFIILDALVDLMPGADENSAGDTHPIFMALRAIAEDADAALVVIHHNSKAGQYRGSSAIHGAVDLLLSIKKQGDALTFEVVKGRDVEPFSFGATGTWVPGEFYLVSTAVVPPGPTFTPSQREIMKRLRDYGVCSLQELMDSASVCSPGTARNQVYHLTTQGYLQRANGGGKGTAALYELTPSGRLQCALW